MLVACTICGKEFERRRHGPSKYCGAPCRRVFELREYHRKRADRGLPKLGDKVDCERCGKSTERRNPSGPFYCPECSKARPAEKTRDWRSRNPDKVFAIQQSVDQKRRNDPERLAYLRLRSARMRATPRGKLDHAIVSLLRANMQRGSGRVLMHYLGYAPADLRSHFERQFVEGMTWDNFGSWNIDHIVPKASFTYRSPDDPDFRACWALTNLRPLWKQANVRKSAKRTHLL